MFRATLLAFSATICLSGPAAADKAEDVRALYEAMGLPELIDVMRAEGITYGAEIREAMFPGRGGSSWPAIVEQIYDPVTMGDAIFTALDAGLEEGHLDPLLDFYTSARGVRIVGFEVSAREAFLDEDVEAAAEDRMWELRQDGAPLIDKIEEFITANDLIETNVMGAMNSNYAFYSALLDSGQFGQAMSEQDILADVWAQEEEIRDETETWLYSYLSMAYQPLDVSDLEAYVALSKTEAGRALNTALFAGFDRAFVRISRSLGAAGAKFMVGEDI